MSYCKDCANWKHSTIRPNYCEVFDWQSEADDFCSFEDREPQPKKGKWIITGRTNIYGGKEIKCPICDYSFMTSPKCEGHENFCCNCGARMESRNEAN